MFCQISQIAARKVNHSIGQILPRGFALNKPGPDRRPGVQWMLLDKEHGVGGRMVRAREGLVWWELTFATATYLEA